MGTVIEMQLGTPLHHLRITTHHPEACIMHFKMTVHRDNAEQHGILKVDDAKFYIWASHENDHAALMKCMLHVRVVEDLLVKFWSLEGAKEGLTDIGCVDCLDKGILERGTPRSLCAGTRSGISLIS
ncbi:d-3-phosphoglycerate chloroplastic [Hordeum vulgare]|nr:d-3-phosphoglycerate chloroplastic [Hordeum vulgare]